MGFGLMMELLWHHIDLNKDFILAFDILKSNCGMVPVSALIFSQLKAGTFVIMG